MATSKNMLFFNYSAGIWAHSATDALLLNRLSRRGVNLSTMSCDGFVSGLCLVRRSRKRTPADISRNRNIDCGDCKFSAKLVNSAAKAQKSEKFWLGQYLSRESRKEAEEFVQSWTSSGCEIDSEFYGVPVARIAGYEVSLAFKSWEEGTVGSGRPQYVQAVLDVALTVMSARAFFATHKSFDAVIVRSPHYSINGAFASVAKISGERVILVDGSPNLTEDYTHLVMWDWNRYGSGSPAKSLFPQVLASEDKVERERVGRHFLALERGKSHKVYSSAKARGQFVLEDLGADPSKKTVLLALSSTDEVISSLTARVNPNLNYPGSVFKDQYEWVRQTVSFFRTRSEYQLILRIHPREFPNKRESVTSPAALRWERELSVLPSNVFVDHPKRKRSLYDLFDQVDLTVTGWSSVGLEAAFHGVALVTYDSELPGYPAAIGLTGTSKGDYFGNLEKALTGAADVPFKDNALQWMHFYMNLGTTRLGGRFLASRRSLLPRWVNLILEGLDRYLYFVYRPLDLCRGIHLEPTDGKFERVALDGMSNLYE